MFSPKNYEYECTRACRLRSHSNAITAALTKRSVDDSKLAAYIAKTCCNYADIVDDLGRSAVHICASVDRHDILEWLLNQDAIITGRDFESGSTPLHRAIFYGCIDCVVLLMRYGASVEALDNDTRLPLQHVCRVGDYQIQDSVQEKNELLVWGCNKNDNLGISNEQGSNDLPQMLDYFRKEQISISSVALGAYHSLFLDKKKNLYAVGHGKGGRLGIGNENSLSTPRKVKVTLKSAKEEIIGISVSRKHSLVLTNRSLVFACGLNEDKQLGVREAKEKLLTFKEVVTLRDMGVTGIRKVIAKDYHSLAYTDNCIYVWGANLGQMGLDADVKIVAVPRMMKLPPNTTIVSVEAGNGATVVLTGENTVLIFHNHKMKVLKAPNYEPVKLVALIEGDCARAEKGNGSSLKLLIVTKTNVVFVWYLLTQSFYRCTFPQIRLAQIDNILYKANQILVLSQGDVYKGRCHQVTAPHSDSEINGNTKQLGNIWSRYDNRSADISKSYVIRIDLEPMLNIDRAVDIFCDDDFASFAVLQESCSKYFKMPALNPQEYTFKNLYCNVDEYDAVHDIVFHVDGEKYPAHKYLIHSRASGIKDLIQSSEDKNVYLNFDGLTATMFEVILKYIYTNYLPNEQDLEDIQSSLNPNAPSDLSDVCMSFLQVAEQFRLTNICSFFKYYLQQQPFYLPHMADRSKYRFSRLKHSDHPELYDVRIICENNAEIQAHKCVLVARLEYFEMMFNHTWAEQNVINLTTVPQEYMQAIVEFIYSLDVEQFRKQQYRESFLYNMIVFCDQFFIERLRNVCEILLLDKLSIRKCGEMLDFAAMYNCEILQNGCLDFICQNMVRVLLQKSLLNCEPAALKKINSHYRRMFQNVFDYRMITPNSEAVADDDLNNFVRDFQVDLSFRMDDEQLTHYRAMNKTKAKDNKVRHTSTRQYEREAISTMMDELSVRDDREKQANEANSQNLKETESISNRLQSEAKSWMRVTDKKENRRRISSETATKVNEILNQEPPPQHEFSSLRKSDDASGSSHIKTQDREDSDTAQAQIPGAASKGYNITLAELTTPPRDKMSQKQRKRLSSENKNSLSWRSPAKVELKSPAESPNAWGIVAPTTAQAALNDLDVATGTLQDPSSFANIARSSKGEARTQQNSFTQILAEEKRQRDYYERLRNKPLSLTQIEEQAIADLKEFYNVDNIADEVITIQRKSVPTTINFAVWQRN